MWRSINRSALKPYIFAGLPGGLAENAEAYRLAEAQNSTNLRLIQLNTKPAQQTMPYATTTVINRKEHGTNRAFYIDTSATISCTVAGPVLTQCAQPPSSYENWLSVDTIGRLLNDTLDLDDTLIGGSSAFMTDAVLRYLKWLSKHSKRLWQTANTIHHSRTPMRIYVSG